MSAKQTFSPLRLKTLYIARWPRRKALDFCFGANRFDFRPGHRLSWLRHQWEPVNRSQMEVKQL
jgi:hypothetical protein